MKKLVSLMLAAFSVLAGCKRKPAEGEVSNAQAQLGGGREIGYLALKVLKSHEHRKPLDASPWHAEGGDWTFMECQFTDSAEATVLIGVNKRATSKGNIPISWGEAMIAVKDTNQGARFLEVLSKAFQQELPTSYAGKAPLHFRMQTAILGEKMVRERDSGFSRSGKGKWTATKWFLQSETGDAEVFFNFSPADGKAEFSEKDPDYRESLIQQLTTALRDGPLPERPPENAPHS